jgi:hypothetical protein
MRNVIRVFLVVAAAACASKNHATPGLVDPMSGTGGTEGSGGSGGGEEDASDDQGSSMVPCGTKSCRPDEYCCDGACGACAAIGTNCPADPCGDGAAANDGAPAE